MFKSGVLTSNEMDSDLLFDRGWLIDRGRSIIRSLVIQLGVVFVFASNRTFQVCISHRKFQKKREDTDVWIILNDRTWRKNGFEFSNDK